MCIQNTILNRCAFCQDIRSFFGGASKATTKAPEATKGEHMLHVAAQVNTCKAYQPQVAIMTINIAGTKRSAALAADKVYLALEASPVTLWLKQVYLRTGQFSA